MANDKRERRMMRELAGEAHRRELNAALEELDRKFQQWREGRLSPFDLNGEIHEHHNGISRELWGRYSSPGGSISVPGALARGVLTEADIPPLLRDELVRAAEMLKDAADRRGPHEAPDQEG